MGARTQPVGSIEVHAGHGSGDHAPRSRRDNDLRRDEVSLPAGPGIPGAVEIEVGECCDSSGLRGSSCDAGVGVARDAGRSGCLHRLSRRRWHGVRGGREKRHCDHCGHHQWT
jgi:hypothetical protein